MFDDVAVYNQRIMSAEQLPAVVNQAIRMAYTKKVYPFLQFQMMSRNSEVKNGARITNTSFTLPELFPQKEDLDAAKLAINAATKPVILAGKGAKHARESLLAFAEHIGAQSYLHYQLKALFG